MTKIIKKPLVFANWRENVVRFLPWIILIEFILRQFLEYIPLWLYSFLMWANSLSPLVALSGIANIITDTAFNIFINDKYFRDGQWLVPNGADLLYLANGLLIIILHIAFIITLFRRSKLAWFILLLSVIITILKNYGLWETGGGRIFRGFLNGQIILAILGIYILSKIRYLYTRSSL